MICKICSSTIPDDVTACPICRSPVQPDNYSYEQTQAYGNAQQESPVYEQPQADYSGAQQYGYTPPMPKQNKPMTSKVWLYAAFALSALSGSVPSLVLAAIALILFERKALFAERGDFMQVNYYDGLIRKLGIAAWVLFAVQALVIVAAIVLTPILTVFLSEFMYDDYYYYGIMSALM